MTINNITQTISTIPEAAHRGVDVQTVFVIKQEDFQDHLQGITVDELNTLKDQLNSRIGEINSTATTMNGYADTASAGASTATTKAGEASTSAGEALAYRNQAETFKNNASSSATKASQWSDNNYNVEVEAGRYSAKHWSTVAQNTVNNKIDKVTSTDNAVVRFNGTTGDVQNSGVTIDDNNNIIIKGSTGGSGLFISKSNNSNTLSAFGDKAQIVGGIKDTTTCIYSANGVPIAINMGSTEVARIDASGNVGIGVNPSAWQPGVVTGVDVKDYYNYGASVVGGHGVNTYYNAGWKYKYSGTIPLNCEIGNGAFKWQTAPSGTAGNAITWTNAMTLDASGNLNVGYSNSFHSFGKMTGSSAGTNGIFAIANLGADEVFRVCDATYIGGANTAGSAVRIGMSSTTSRSINASGTINASGADYAEYEYSNDITLVKGQIVGFKADGTLTDKYSEAIRFAIKSTNPSIVGADTWGIEEIVGKRPEKPVKSEEMTEEEFAELEELYELELADFEARLEVERQKVDRIAYAGKVPVNVYGAVPGQYVIAIEKNSGIDGKLLNKSDMTFAEYQDAVGRVNKILDDGRAEVAVIIH